MKGVSSNSIQNFLDWFSETAMFTAFIESRLDRTLDPRGKYFYYRHVPYISHVMLIDTHPIADISKVFLIAK